MVECRRLLENEVVDMSKFLVFGHQNPDTDAIASSYGWAHLEREVFGRDAEAVALGTPNEETAFALEYFGVTAPRVVESAKAEGVNQVILTDHNEFQQSIADIKEVEVAAVIDHHRVANFETANPLYMRLEPVGSASSIVYRAFKENGVTPPKEVAGLLLSGLISDTLLLKSPTTHATDPQVAAELAEIAGVNLEEYGLALLKAGTNLASKSAEELIDIDAKTFALNGSDVRVAQVNTVDIAEVLERQEEIEVAMTAAIVSEGYSDFVLMITDIVNSNSEIVALGSNMDKVEAAFNFKLENNHAFLPGAVSRKKQVVPQLTDAFNA
jgi:manganese-dependent inorganic pyrophosphatase